MTQTDIISALEAIYPASRWPKPLHILKGVALHQANHDLREVARSVGTTAAAIRQAEESGDLLLHIVGCSINEISEPSRAKARLILGQLLLGRCAELAFEEIYRNEMHTQELELRDLREGRTDTDYRLFNGMGRPVFRINIKFHGSRFRRSAELVGIEPNDCFALATYKIHSALQKQDQDQLPYVFAIVGVPHVSGESVGASINPTFVDLSALIHQAPKAHGKRDIEDAVISHLVSSESEIYRSTLAAIRGADWYILSARRAHNLLRDLLFDRVFALRIRNFSRTFKGAELDMHFSLERDLTPLRRYFETLREGGSQRVTTLLERGDF